MIQTFDPTGMEGIPYSFWYERDRLKLERNILDAIAEGGDLFAFELLHGEDVIRTAKCRLMIWGCLNANGKLTEVGERVRDFDLMVPFALMMSEAIKRGVVEDVAILVAILETGPCVYTINDLAMKLLPKMEVLSDALVQISLFKKLIQMEESTRSYFNVDENRLSEIEERWMEILSDIGLAPREDALARDVDDRNVLLCLLMGCYFYLYRKIEDGTYANSWDPNYRVLGSRGMLQNPEWVVGFPLNFFSKPKSSLVYESFILAEATEVDPKWLTRIHPELRTRKVGKCQFDPKAKQVVRVVTEHYLGHEISRTIVPCTDDPELLERIKASHEQRKVRFLETVVVPEIVYRRTWKKGSSTTDGPVVLNKALTPLYWELLMTEEECGAFLNFVTRPRGRTSIEEATELLGQRFLDALIEYGYLQKSSTDKTVLTLNEELLSNTTFCVQFPEKEALTHFRVKDYRGAKSGVARDWMARLSHVYTHRTKHKPCWQKPIYLQSEFAVSTTEARVLVELFMTPLFTQREIVRILGMDLIRVLCEFDYMKSSLDQFNRLTWLSTRFRVYRPEEMPIVRFVELPEEQRILQDRNDWLTDLEDQLKGFEKIDPIELEPKPIDILSICLKHKRMPIMVRACLLWLHYQGKSFTVFEGSENFPDHLLGFGCQPSFQVFVSKLSRKSQMPRDFEPILKSTYENGWTRATYSWAQNPFDIVSQKELEDHGIPHIR